MVPLVEGDFISEEDSIKLFPKDAHDEFGQQIDLREDNSWVAPIEEVSIIIVPYMRSNLYLDFHYWAGRRSVHQRLRAVHFDPENASAVQLVSKGEYLRVEIIANN